MRVQFEGGMTFDFAAVLYEIYCTPIRGAWRLRELIFGFTQPLVPKSIYALGKKLNLGSSSKLLPSYVNVDLLPENKPDVVCNVDKLDFASEGEYDLVRASHILEHFSSDEWKRVLTEWRRVLKPGGYLVVCCPDYIRLSWRAILYPDGFNPFSNSFLPGWMSGLFALDLPPGLRHKSVFTEESLRQLLCEVGFSVLGRQVYQVEEPYTLGITDGSCNIYSVNIAAQKSADWTQWECRSAEVEVASQAITSDRVSEHNGSCRVTNDFCERFHQMVSDEFLKADIA